MEKKNTALTINKKAFFQSFFILLAMMLLAGILTRIIPSGTYLRTEMDGRMMIHPSTFQPIPRPDYPAWRWFVAPVEVLGGPDGLTVLTIILFLVMIGAAFAVLEKTGLLLAGITRVVDLFGGRKYILLLTITFLFMIMGAFLGIFEEVVPLVPIMLAVSFFLGWDSLVGLGMSILAVNMGFSAAITNPFTIGVAQKIAGLPLFSGAGYRLIIFLVFFGIYALFLTNYARRLDNGSIISPVASFEKTEKEKYQLHHLHKGTQTIPHAGRAAIWLLSCLFLILIVLVSGPFISLISEYSLPLVGILFLAAGLGAGFIGGAKPLQVITAAMSGMKSLLPGIPLILMAASIKYIAAQGGILDTILHSAATLIGRTGSFGGALATYLIALFFEIFIGSGSAKAFLVMPILLPLADLVGVSRQLTVLAYCFGDGFSNLAYPTNPVLLISLGLTVVSYPQWIRWTLKLWFWVILASIAFLGMGVLIHYGPF